MKTFAERHISSHIRDSATFRVKSKININHKKITQIVISAFTLVPETNKMSANAAEFLQNGSENLNQNYGTK